MNIEQETKQKRSFEELDESKTLDEKSGEPTQKLPRFDLTTNPLYRGTEER